MDENNAVIALTQPKLQQEHRKAFLVFFVSTEVIPPDPTKDTTSFSERGNRCHPQSTSTRTKVIARKAEFYTADYNFHYKLPEINVAMTRFITKKMLVQKRCRPLTPIIPLKLITSTLYPQPVYTEYREEA